MDMAKHVPATELKLALKVFKYKTEEKNGTQTMNQSRFSFSWNTDKQYMLGLKCVVGKNLTLSGSYDSDYEWGTGINLIY